jgi:hypothetical protein
MRRTARAVVFGTLTAIIVVSFAIPAFAVRGQVPCGQYPPNPFCPSQSRGHRGGAPGLQGRTVGQGGPGPHGNVAAATSASAPDSGPGNSENAPGHTGTAGNSANSNGHGNHTSTTIPGVMTPAGLLLIGGFLLTLLAIRRRNRRALLTS